MHCGKGYPQDLLLVFQTNSNFWTTINMMFLSIKKSRFFCPGMFSAFEWCSTYNPWWKWIALFQLVVVTGSNNWTNGIILSPWWHLHKYWSNNTSTFFNAMIMNGTQNISSRRFNDYCGQSCFLVSSNALMVGLYYQRDGTICKPVANHVDRALSVLSRQ